MVTSYNLAKFSTRNEKHIIKCKTIRNRTMGKKSKRKQAGGGLLFPNSYDFQ